MATPSAVNKLIMRRLDEINERLDRLEKLVKALNEKPVPVRGKAKQNVEA